jgi:hypothetical protein
MFIFPSATYESKLSTGFGKINNPAVAGFIKALRREGDSNLFSSMLYVGLMQILKGQVHRLVHQIIAFVYKELIFNKDNKFF